LVERWGEGVDEVARSDGGRDVFKHQNGGRERVGPGWHSHENLSINGDQKYIIYQIYIP
jgi:hypothetical protein